MKLNISEVGFTILLQCSALHFGLLSSKVMHSAFLLFSRFSPKGELSGCDVLALSCSGRAKGKEDKVLVCKEGKPGS